MIGGPDPVDPAPSSAPPGGVGAWGRRPASTRSFLTVMSVGAVATAVALWMGVVPLLRSARERRAQIAADQAQAANRAAARARASGDTGAPRASLRVRVFAAAGAAVAHPVDGQVVQVVSASEQIRIGVDPGSHAFLLVFSLDERGAFTALYPQAGESLAVPSGAGMHDLPDNLELTGQGAERLVVVLSDEPVQVDAVRRAAGLAFQQSGRRLRDLPRLAVPGEQFHRLFLKTN